MHFCSTLRVCVRLYLLAISCFARSVHLKKKSAVIQADLEERERERERERLVRAIIHTSSELAKFISKEN